MFAGIQEALQDVVYIAFTAVWGEKGYMHSQPALQRLYTALPTRLKHLYTELFAPFADKPLLSKLSPVVVNTWGPWKIQANVLIQGRL